MMRCLTKRLVVACMVFLLVAISMLCMSHLLAGIEVTRLLDSLGVSIVPVEQLLPFLLGIVEKESKEKRAKRRIRLSDVKTVYDLDKEDKKKTENVSEFFPHVVDNDRKRVPRNIPKSVWEVRWVLRKGEYRKDLSGYYIIDEEADKVLFEVWRYMLVQGMFTYRYSPVRETPGTRAYWNSLIDKDVEIKETKDLEKGAATGTIISYDPLSAAKHKNTRVLLDKRDGQKEAVEKNFRFGDVELFEAFRALGVIGLGSSIVGLRVYVTLNGYCYMQKLVDGVRLPEGILNIDNACPLFIRAKGYWKLQYGITEREELVAEGVVYYRSEKYGYKYQLGHVLSLDRVADYKKKNIKRKLGTKRAAAKQAALTKNSGGTEVYDPATDVEYYNDNRVTVKIDGESEPRVVWLIGGYAEHMNSIVPGGCLRVVVIGNIAFIDERQENGDILLIPELSVGELEDNLFFEAQDRLQLTLQEEGVGEERKLADPFPVIKYDLGVGEDSENKLE